MATTARTTPPVRRPPGSTPASGNIAKGATARSAVSPKVQSSLNGISRRSPSLRGSVSSVVSEGDSAAHEALSAALKRETEEKEELLGRIQDKEQIISDLSQENSNLSHAISAAESRIQELYADQARMEEEFATRLELVERLRAQLQETEREKRDLTRRYNEQTATFDAERQSFYDNEQHLKSRIQTLSQTRKAENQSYPPLDTTYSDVDTESVVEVENPTPETPANAAFPKAADDDDEPAEMTSLRLELATLSTSHSSLQNTVQMLSTQVYDLQRVNNQLQEENESYNILLTEKTMSGRFDILRTVGTQDSDEEEVVEEGQIKDDDDSSLFTRERTVLEPVEEAVESLDPELLEWEKQEPEPGPEVEHEHHRRHGRSRKISTMSRRSRSPTAKGESLADLPVAGPGLDLAAELGRAENQAILEGRVNPSDVRDQSVLNGKNKKGAYAQVNRKVSLATLADHANPNDIDALRNEVKSLKDANKALSLYASKILDRIISQEGFEHVLAVDFDKSPTKQTPGSPTRPSKDHAKDEKQVSTRKERSQSVIYDKAPSSPIESTSKDTSPAIPQSPQAVPSERPSTKSQRRSLSFDWRSFSVFGAGEKKQESSSAPLRPLTLRPGATSVVSARKLETHEDEDDRRERERMNATLKLMGIEKPESSAQPPTPVMKSFSSPTPSVDPASPKPAASRFSFFRSKSTQSETSSLKSTHSGTNSINNQTLTQEALERAEAEITLANLDAKERVLSEEIAKGSSSGFTELPKRQNTSDWKSRRSKRSGGSGSGSTVWSAGMSTHREGSDEE